MPYDPNLDAEKFAETVELDLTRIKVSVHSYNEGTPKLQLSRENRNQTTGDWRFSKLGRMTSDEVEAIMPLMKKALEHMKTSEAKEE